jgi:hypothetical protein
MCRAVLEGVCFQVRDIFEVTLEQNFLYTKTRYFFVYLLYLQLAKQRRCKT